jgi:hypothetical protein
MQTLADNPPSLLLWGIGTAVTLLSTAGYAALITWMPAPTGASRDALPVSRVERAKPGATVDAGTLPLKKFARRKVRCDECGLIESIRETAGHGDAIPHRAAGGPVAKNRSATPVKSASREITVRLEDGSRRVIIDANPAKWRLGERVIVINGVVDPGS